MTNKRWVKSRTATYNIAYHLIWCPKYRRNVLVDGVEKRLRELMLDVCNKHNFVIGKLEIMPDHVHLFVKANPIQPPQWIVKQFKGYTSRILRSEFPKLKSRLPTLWTRSYYCESVGHISEKTIKKYIEAQKGK